MDMRHYDGVAEPDAERNALKLNSVRVLTLWLQLVWQLWNYYYIKDPTTRLPSEIDGHCLYYVVSSM